MDRKPNLFLVICALLISLIACQSVNSRSVESDIGPLPPHVVYETVVSPVYIPPAVDLIAMEDALVEVYDRVNPGVVSIRGINGSGDSLGSGFVVDQEGHIVTNYHVIEGADQLEIAFPSGKKTRAEVLGTDLDSDIAVIKVELDPADLHPLPLSDSDLVRVGQTVVAIGNPFGFRGTMTVGIVSGLGRSMESLHDAPGGGVFSAGDIIQTDAAINPGNSGGPLINLNGEVVGVNRAIYTSNFSSSGDPVSSGLGFAISINIIKRVMPALIAKGEYAYPYVGISSINDLSLLQQEALNLSQATGVYVNRITAGSPAERAGLIGGSSSTAFPDLRAGGDLIIAIDGIEVLTFADFIGYIIKNKSPGDLIQMTVVRDGVNVEIDLTLGERPANN
jgi:S1-C subfamily serine protease